MLPGGRALGPPAPTLWQEGPGSGGAALSERHWLQLRHLPPCPSRYNFGLLSCSTLGHSLSHPGSAHVYIYVSRYVCACSETDIHPRPHLKNVRHLPARMMAQRMRWIKLKTTRGSTGQEENIEGPLKEKQGKRLVSEQRKVADKEGLSCHRLRPGQSLQLCQLRAQPRSPGSLALEVKMELVG